MDRVTQTKKTLEALQAAGDAGLPSTWFDDLKIKRGAARIYDLKQVGYIIDSKREGPGCRYFLRPNEQLALEVSDA